MDLIELKVQMRILERLLDLKIETGVPQVHYSASDDQMQASTAVASGFEKLPLGTIMNRLTLTLLLCNGALIDLLPDLQKDDFVLKFYILNAGGQVRLFAQRNHFDCALK
jgi:hypothetical protein